MKMTGYFVWSVKGEYTSRYKPLDSAVTEATTRPFECMVLTRDPLGMDVSPIRIFNAKSCVITEMRCLGWAQGEDESASAADAPLEPRSDYDSGLCCMRDHANATPPWTCSCPCHTRVEPPEGAEG